MSLKKVTCSILVIAVMIGASALSFTNTTEAANNTPVTKDIYMLKGETRVAYFSFNLTAFEFNDLGDGYCIFFGKDSDLKTQYFALVNKKNFIIEKKISLGKRKVEYSLRKINDCIVHCHPLNSVNCLYCYVKILMLCIEFTLQFLDCLSKWRNDSN